MKTSTIIIVFTCLFSVATFAGSPSSAKSATTNNHVYAETGFSTLLPLYLEIKDALVASNSTAAAAKAAAFMQAAEAVDTKSLTKTQLDAFNMLKAKLVLDARHISETKELSHQREHFAAFSLNMWKLVKAGNPSSSALYQQYCPMKKTYWISAGKAIKNPYYGSAMLTCGEVTASLN